MFAPVFETMLTYKTYEFRIPRNSIPGQENDNLYRMEDDAVFKILSFCAPAPMFNTHLFEKYALTFKHLVDRLRGQDFIYIKHYVYRVLYENAISNFDIMSNQWRNLFENHYNTAFVILSTKSPRKCFEKTYAIIETFITMAEEYLLTNINLVFHLPQNRIKNFAIKYPTAMYFATLKKAEMHWIDKKTAHVACTPFLVEMRLKIIAGLLYVTRKFPREICAIIYDYLVITHAPVRPFSQYFNDVYDFTKKEVKDKNLVKFIKRIRIPNIQTMTYTDTISVQIYDDFTF